MEKSVNSNMSNYLSALATFQSVDHQTGIGLCLNNIGNIHMERQEFRLALECFKKATAISQDQLNEEMKLPIDFSYDHISEGKQFESDKNETSDVKTNVENQTIIKFQQLNQHKPAKAKARKLSPYRKSSIHQGEQPSCTNPESPKAIKHFQIFNRIQNIFQQHNSSNSLQAHHIHRLSMSTRIQTTVNQQTVAKSHTPQELKALNHSGIHQQKLHQINFKDETFSSLTQSQGFSHFKYQKDDGTEGNSRGNHLSHLNNNESNRNNSSYFKLETDRNKRHSDVQNSSMNNFVNTAVDDFLISSQRCSQSNLFQHQTGFNHHQPKNQKRDLVSILTNHFQQSKKDKITQEEKKSGFTDDKSYSGSRKKQVKNPSYLSNDKSFRSSNVERNNEQEGIINTNGNQQQDCQDSQQCIESRQQQMLFELQLENCPHLFSETFAKKEQFKQKEQFKLDGQLLKYRNTNYLHTKAAYLIQAAELLRESSSWFVTLASYSQIAQIQDLHYNYTCAALALLNIAEIYTFLGYPYGSISPILKQAKNLIFSHILPAEILFQSTINKNKSTNNNYTNSNVTTLVEENFQVAAPIDDNYDHSSQENNENASNLSSNYKINVNTQSYQAINVLQVPIDVSKIALIQENTCNVQQSISNNNSFNNINISNNNSNNHIKSTSMNQLPQIMTTTLTTINNQQETKLTTTNPLLDTTANFAEFLPFANQMRHHFSQLSQIQFLPEKPSRLGNQQDNQLFSCSNNAQANHLNLDNGISSKSCVMIEKTIGLKRITTFGNSPAKSQNLRKQISFPMNKSNKMSIGGSTERSQLIKQRTLELARLQQQKQQHQKQQQSSGGSSNFSKLGSLDKKSKKKQSEMLDKIKIEDNCNAQDVTKNLLNSGILLSKYYTCKAVILVDEKKTRSALKSILKCLNIFFPNAAVLRRTGMLQQTIEDTLLISENILKTTSIHNYSQNKQQYSQKCDFDPNNTLICVELILKISEMQQIVFQEKERTELLADVEALKKQSTLIGRPCFVEMFFRDSQEV